MKKKVLYGILGTVAGYALIVSSVLNKEMRKMKRFSIKETIQRETETGRFNLEAFENLPKEDFSVTSKSGYVISGTHYMAAPASAHVMIIAHGVAVNKYNSIKYMNLFLKRGWNVVLYDQRYHGNSGGNEITYGFHEKDDLASVIQWTKKRYNENLKLGVHGESMGASTALLYAGKVEDGADFYIADCPYSDFAKQVAHRIKVQFRLPAFMLLPAANLFVRLADGYRFQEVAPIQVVDRIQKPVLFLHSVPDTYIPVKMTIDLYNQKTKGFRQIHLFEKGDHAMSLVENKEEYEQVVSQFLQAIEMDAQLKG